PCSCAAICATAPGFPSTVGTWASLSGRPRGSPNRALARLLLRRGGIPPIDAPPVTRILQERPVAVAEAAEHPPGERLTEPDELGDEASAGDAVRGDDDALPRLHGGRELRQCAPGALRDVGQGLP